MPHNGSYLCFLNVVALHRKSITRETPHSSNTAIGNSVLVPIVYVEKRFLPAPLIFTDKTDNTNDFGRYIGFIGVNQGYRLKKVCA